MTNMHLGKWGRSLALRIPAALVKQLGLKEGDPVNAELIQAALVEAKRLIDQERRKAALEEIGRGRITLPADWKFDREEANWRPAIDRW